MMIESRNKRQLAARQMRDSRPATGKRIKLDPSAAGRKDDETTKSLFHFAKRTKQVQVEQQQASSAVGDDDSSPVQQEILLTVPNRTDYWKRRPLVSNDRQIEAEVSTSVVRLNVGGTSFRLSSSAVSRRAPHSLLGRFVCMEEEARRHWADGFLAESDEYFFERCPKQFGPIFDFLTSGTLHVSKDVCFERFMLELRYWGISKEELSHCCSPFVDGAGEADKPVSIQRDQFTALRCGRLRRRLWNVMEGVVPSLWWKVFEIVSTTFVVVSIVSLVLSSLPSLQVPLNEDDLVIEANTNMNNESSSLLNETRLLDSTESSDGSRRGEKGEEPTGATEKLVEHPVFQYVEYVCVGYFTLEYLVRFLVAPEKWYFVKQPLNVVDLLAILPFICEFLLFVVGVNGNNVRKFRWAFLAMRLLRVLRTVRMAKLARFSPGLANFALTLSRSKKQMQMVAVVMITVVIFFSTLVYFLEKDEPDTKFLSIPASFWWCIVTMTTVGYGDLVPKTIAGKMIGSGAIVCGVMVLALPITIMVNNFMQVIKLKEEKIIRKYTTDAGGGTPAVDVSCSRLDLAPSNTTNTTQSTLAESASSGFCGPNLV